MEIKVGRSGRSGRACGEIHEAGNNAPTASFGSHTADDASACSTRSIPVGETTFFTQSSSSLSVLVNANLVATWASAGFIILLLLPSAVVSHCIQRLSLSFADLLVSTSSSSFCFGVVEGLGHELGECCRVFGEGCFWCCLVVAQGCNKSWIVEGCLWLIASCWI